MYKIVEIEPGKFKIFRKGWFFWRALTESSYAGDTYIVCNSLSAAESMLMMYVRRQADKKSKQASFVDRPHTHLYGDDGYPKRVFRDSNPGY